MGYTVDYKGKNDAVRSAVKDFLDYVGAKNFRLCVQLVKQDAEQEMNMACMMLGVSGFPCRAMWERYNPGALPK